MKQLTERETYIETIKALKRLRRKELVVGIIFDRDLKCPCASGALVFHSRHPGKIDFPEAFWECPELRFMPNIPANTLIVDANDSFRPHDNSLSARKARYEHMLSWLQERVA